jgi:hypothetical protein
MAARKGTYTVTNLNGTRCRTEVLDIPVRVQHRIGTVEDR